MRITELLGFAAGAALAPLLAAGSMLRRARIFHPDGVVYRAEVTIDAPGGPARDVATRLAGPALVRLSAGIRRRTEEGRARRPDVLGIAIRFKSAPDAGVVPEQGDQDMLFATIRSVLTLLPDLLRTNANSFMMDDYHTVTTLDAAELGDVRFKLRTPRIQSGELPREEALEQAVKAGKAIFELQAREARIGAQFQPVARIQLLERVDVDQAALRFSPFRTGRGIVPRGLVNAMRIVPYPASQLARPLKD
jgi:hypothetical protein